MPSTNKDKPHVQCVTDARMSKAVKFTLYKNDDDRGINTDRSRLEMHATAGMLLVGFLFHLIILFSQLLLKLKFHANQARWTNNIIFEQ